MLGGSFTVARIVGIPIRIHWTFFILLVWVVSSGVSRGGTVSAGVAPALFVLGVFGCVTLHELGHALAARMYGVHTRDIILLPIGGVASLERIPDRPLHEFVIAIAGPMVNVVIAAALGAGLAIREGGLGPIFTMEWLSNPTGAFVVNLATVNVWLVIFNLIPAFPMDGGRILRAALAAAMGRTRATTIAAGIGKAIAVLMGIIGLTSSEPMLILVAVFVWLGATGEASAATTREALQRIPVTQAMVRDYKALGVDQAIRDAAAIMLATPQQDFPVTEDGRPDGVLVGLLPRLHIVRALSERGPDSRVGEAMLVDCKTVGPDDDLSQAAQIGYTSGCPVTPVVQEGRLIGLLTPESLKEFMLLQRAGSRRKAPELRRTA